MKKHLPGTMLGIVVFVLVGIFILFIGKVSVSIGEDSFTVEGTLSSSTKVKYSDISSIEYVNNFNVGSRKIGFGTFKMDIGVYSNQELSRYKLYSYRGVDGFVVVYYKEHTLVFNLSTEENTEQIYQKIKERIVI